jgi:metal-responsive CopG/Arc/MetJ family transcriptional regulator
MLDINASNARCRDAMRTTLTLDADVAARIERIRRARGSSLRELINAALRRGLAELEKPKQRRQPFRTRSVSLGPRVANLDDVAGALALAEGDDYR